MLGWPPMSRFPAATRHLPSLWVALSLALALIAAAALFASSIPVSRWAVRGGVPAIADGIGESALEHLDLPSGVAPAVERRLAFVAAQLRPESSLPARSFRVLLSGYADVHSFSIPPDVIVVTTGLVCGAEDPYLVTEAVAIELAHLENRDVHQRVAETVDWHTPIDLMLGDVGALRERMLDFADPKRSPGFTPAQESAARERARPSVNATWRPATLPPITATSSGTRKPISRISRSTKNAYSSFATSSAVGRSGDCIRVRSDASRSFSGSSNRPPITSFGSGMIPASNNVLT